MLLCNSATVGRAEFGVCALGRWGLFVGNLGLGLDLHHGCGSGSRSWLGMYLTVREEGVVRNWMEEGEERGAYTVAGWITANIR
jgi:hypothetical protein